ncbi:hypothetical protein Rsub_12092 [Raphidocelis subcapitata]|uniref:Uncharacterized protein n=1 Tax=Raphidocelis subcapitata TaxID=307507 RepID=A0A2V0PHL3_9CHLO|nr:hypothetical protein Rsub_12092 [Raphidocelis subcapitata]|eukprot:GBF99311.1 hypothetical protein Rsub_12092 [Raphidocelis subcapitata]
MAGSGAAHPSPICPAERPKGGAGAAPPGPAEQLQRLRTDCLWVSWEFRGEPQSPEGPFGGAAGRLRKLFAGQQQPQPGQRVCILHKTDPRASDALASTLRDMRARAAALERRESQLARREARLRRGFEDLASTAQGKALYEATDMARRAYHEAAAQQLELWAAVKAAEGARLRAAEIAEDAAAEGVRELKESHARAVAELQARVQELSAELEQTRAQQSAPPPEAAAPGGGAGGGGAFGGAPSGAASGRERPPPSRALAEQWARYFRDHGDGDEIPAPRRESGRGSDYGDDKWWEEEGGGKGEGAKA